MSQSKLDKLIVILRYLSQNNFKITSAMRKIGIKNKTTLIRRIFLDITSGSVIKDHLYRHAGNPHDVAGVHNWIFSFIRRYRIDSVYLEEMFRPRIVFELSRYGYIRGGRMPDVSEDVRYIERLTESGRIRAARLVWCRIFVDNEIPVDATFGDLDYGQYAFFYNQIATLPWEVLVEEHSQEGYEVTTQYPMQPIHLVNGVVHFEKNPIIDWLVGATDLNKISLWCQNNNIDTKYTEQLYQLLGYSISLYNDLPDVSDISRARANEINDSLLATHVDSSTQPPVPLEKDIAPTQDNFNAKILDRLDAIIDLIKPKEKDSTPDAIQEPIGNNIVSKVVGDKLHLLVVEGEGYLNGEAIDVLYGSTAGVVIFNYPCSDDITDYISSSGKVVITNRDGVIRTYTNPGYFTISDSKIKGLSSASFEIHQN